jgi:hypothetical protein
MFLGGASQGKVTITANLYLKGMEWILTDYSSNESATRSGFFLKG